MIFSQDPALVPSKKRKLIASAINTGVWLAGVIFFKWNIYQLHLLFLIDMGLFVFFGSLRIICSMDSEESFFTSFVVRFFFALICAFFMGLMLVAISGIDESGRDYDNKWTGWMEYAYVPEKWVLGIMVINYCGYFLHDFIFTGKYKTANPGMEGFSDFVSVLVMGMVLSFFIIYGAHNAEDGYIYWFFSAIGIIASRFVMELFLANCGRIIFNKPETEVWGK